MNNQGPQVGDRIAGYRLERVVYRSAAVTVFQAVADRSGRHVAVKILAGSGGATDESATTGIDTASAARLDEHPHIVRMVERGSVDGVEFAVSDFVNGVALRELIERHGSAAPMPPSDAVALLEQLGRAVDVAYDVGAIDTVDLDHLLVEMAGRERVGIVDVGDARPVRVPGDVRPGVAESFARVALFLLSGRSSQIDNDPAAGLPAGAVPAAPVFAAALRPGGYPSAVAFTAALGAALPAPSSTAALHLGALAATGPQPAATAARRRWAAVAAVVLALGAFAAGVAVIGNDDRSTAEATTTSTTPASSTSTSTSTTSTTTSTTTSATTSTTTTTTAAPTLAPTTTVAIGAYGVLVGTPITSPTGPEAGYAVAVQDRAVFDAVAAPGSPAAAYAQWVRVAGAAVDGPAVATENGFGVTADRPVVLANFTVVDGKVATFDECIDGMCTPIANGVTIPGDCAPGEGCPHLGSAGGGLMAYLRATVTLRWPMQVVVYQLVPNGDRTIAAVEEPTQRQFHYDDDTQTFVAIFPDRPTPGTRSELLVTFADGTIDHVQIFYGA